MKGRKGGLQVQDPLLRLQRPSSRPRIGQLCRDSGPGRGGMGGWGWQACPLADTPSQGLIQQATGLLLSHWDPRTLRTTSPSLQGSLGHLFSRPGAQGSTQVRRLSPRVGLLG